MRNTISTLLLLSLLSLSAYSQPSSSSGPYALTLAKWQAILTGTKTASYIVDGSGACRALVAGDIPDLLATYAAASHTHAASAITSGTIATARLGSGTADSTTYLRGDNTWATPSGSVSLSSITSGTLATTLALGTQIITSTGSPTWYTATGQSIKLGTTSPLLALGIANNVQGDTRWALGGYGVSSYDGTKAGIASTGTTSLDSNVATGGSITSRVNNVPIATVSASGLAIINTIFSSAASNTGSLFLMGGSGTSGQSLGAYAVFRGVSATNPGAAEYFCGASGANAKHYFYDKNSIVQAKIDENGLCLPVTATPASAGATGVTGQIAWDSSYVYICTASNTWKRVAIATW